MQKGDWALVTGASSGIGKAFAERLAHRGINLLLVALEEEKLAELSKHLKEVHQIQSIPIALDLSDSASIARISEEVQRRNLSISVLINAAGFGYFGDFCAMSPEQIVKMVQVDVVSLVLLCQHFLPKMRLQRRGVIINIASIAGCLPYPYAAVYSGGKSFVHFFTKALWAENQEKSIKIISLCPGYTKTNFEKVSNEPSGIHLFPPENPNDIAEKTLVRVSRSRSTLFTRPTHPFKVFAARLIPLKIFAGLLRWLSLQKLSD